MTLTDTDTEHRTPRPAPRPTSALSEAGTLLRLGAPVLLTQMGVMVVSFADTMMVGAYSTEALAAAAFVNNLFMVPMVMMIGFAAGLTPLIGALYTRGEKAEAGRTLRGAMLLNALCALLMLAVMGGLYFFLDRMGQPPELLPSIRSYYLIVLAAMLPAPFFNTCQQTANGVTDTLMPMCVILGANALNILGNWLLIYGHWGLPELGLDGAGISTVAARAGATAAILLLMLRTRRYRPYAEGLLRRRADRPLLRRIAATSVPVMAQNGAEVAMWSFGAVVCGWYGKEQLAAYQVTNIMSQIGFMAYLSFGIAVSIRVANKTGLRDHAGIRRTARAGLGLNLALAVAASAIFWFCSAPLLGAFTPDAAVVRAATALILPLILYQLFDATQVTYSNALRGTGRVQPLLWVSVACYLAAGLPLMLLLAGTLRMESVGVYYSFCLMLAAAGAAYIHYFRRAARRAEAETPTH